MDDGGWWMIMADGDDDGEDDDDGVVVGGDDDAWNQSVLMKFARGRLLDSCPCPPRMFFWRHCLGWILIMLGVVVKTLALNGAYVQKPRHRNHVFSDHFFEWSWRPRPSICGIGISNSLPAGHSLEFLKTAARITNIWTRHFVPSIWPFGTDVFVAMLTGKFAHELRKICTGIFQPQTIVNQVYICFFSYLWTLAFL